MHARNTDRRACHDLQRRAAVPPRCARHPGLDPRAARDASLLSHRAGRPRRLHLLRAGSPLQGPCQAPPLPPGAPAQLATMRGRCSPRCAIQQFQFLDSSHLFQSTVVPARSGPAHLQSQVSRETPAAACLCYHTSTTPISAPDRTIPCLVTCLGPHLDI